MSLAIVEPTVAVITQRQVSLLNNQDQTCKKLAEYVAALVARSLWVGAYFLLFTLPNPLNPVPSKMGPPLHVTFFIAIIMLRDVVKITYGVRRLLKFGAAINTEGLTRPTSSAPDYREAVVKGLMQGFLLSTVEDALAQAGDGNIV